MSKSRRSDLLRAIAQQWAIAQNLKAPPQWNTPEMFQELRPPESIFKSHVHTERLEAVLEWVKGGCCDRQDKWRIPGKYKAKGYVQACLLSDQEILGMHEQGIKKRAIAEKAGVSPARVGQIIKRLGNNGSLTSA